ncbi:hypothetical protein L6164_014741 [Bauhinia variegata]|uniref:Uncharacterized protein n=1 Tax=Bauhinia variegata TaxID=167791 RepID=A0ACB9NN67_BAUVA|nr:hypothetical protein L6164_014741 [Bauhinia variegata]
MTSNMSSGERRWASSRRGGMTVLGKVSVPKPINLPSQRLENHGLDPNVEIVPKGTLSWGSRSSSSATNAWGSSSVSPNTDGTSSPSHLSARPSSGGSGTRPSTAGSDRALESTPNIWGSTSRPSSASGALTSNQASLTSLRPRSAETRPGSSQLSRFAEPLADNSVAWSAARTAEKLGVTEAKNEEFSLSSGDFPTLGSEKDKSVKNSELQDHSSHSRPGSSSGLGKEKTETSYIDEVPVNANVKGGAVTSWRRDCPAYSEDGDRPSVEKWQGPQPYPNSGIPPPHYDTWHGPPVSNPQGGVWFRGPPGGPPFGNHVAPGGFPMEPFSYYRPHVPPTALGNPPAVPPAGGPRGHYPKNGDVYRPQMPDAYIRPGMPMGPGFYPGPMAYEGYYPPPMGFCNSNERDVTFMGMAAGPSVYNRYSNQNPTEHGNSQGKASGYGSTAKSLAPEQVESRHPPDTSRPYRVLLKQHNEWHGKNESSSWEDSGTMNESYGDGKDQPRMPVREDEQRSDYYRKNQDMDLRASASGEEACSQTSENQGIISSVTVKAKSSESTENIKTFDDKSTRKLNAAASGVQEVTLQPSAPKDSSLIQKIEGLNAKARDNSSARNRDGQRNKLHTNSAPVNPVETEVTAAAGSLVNERSNSSEIINSLPHEVVASGGERNIGSSAFSGSPTSRQTAHGMQGRADHRNKGRSNAHDADGWRKKSMVAETLSPAKVEATNVQVGDHLISVETYDRSAFYQQARHDVESVQIMSDTSDNQAQLAKMKELAKQKTKKLQEEEEERTRKQKAKALVKLDELNRRTQAMEGSIQKENATKSAIENKQEELPSESTSGSGLARNSNALAESSGNQKKKNNNRNGKSKHKVEEISSLPAIPSAISKEGNPTKISVESDHPKTPNFELDQDSVQPLSISKDPNEYLEQRRNLPNEESHGRNSQWKSQHSRRMPRNMQISRPVEKSHGNDAVMWAPVKPQNKTEIMDELTDKSKIEAVNFVKGDQQVHGNFKNKRAEMERYIPKPVAKEMAQHGSVQQMASSSNQSATDETVGRADSGSHAAQGNRHTSSAVSKVGSGIESKNGDGKQSKQGKMHGSWRQRGSTESTNVHDMQGAFNHDSNSYHSFQGSTDQQQAQKSEMSSVKGSRKHFDDSSYADGLNNSNSHDSAAPVSPSVIRDQTSGRGRRVPLRGNKNHDFDHKKNGGETNKIETQVSSSDSSQLDAGAAFKENRGAGERFTSHWQPKSQGSNNQRGNRSNDQNVGSEVGRVNKKDSATLSGVSLSTSRDKETNDHIAQPPHDQSVSGKTKAGQGPQLGNQEAKRERRNAPTEGRSLSPNQVPVSSVEHEPTDMDIRHEQRPSSGFRRNGNQNRFGRGHDSRDWKSSGQDNRHHNQPGNRERQGENMHYEYYPVGPYDNSKVAGSGRPKDDNRSGARFRERGQTHSRRGGGNFHARQGGSVD